MPKQQEPDNDNLVENEDGGNQEPNTREAQEPNTKRSVSAKEAQEPNTR